MYGAKLKQKILILISIGIVLMLSGCFQTEEKVLEDAIDNAQAAFDAKPLEINQTIDQISLHLPKDMEIKGSSVNNVYLEKEEQDYLLFYNQYDDEKSKYLFEGLKERENALLLESFEADGAIGFIAVFPNGEENYELQLGIGSEKKISTITDIDHLETEAYDLMALLRSVQINEEK